MTTKALPTKDQPQSKEGLYQIKEEWEILGTSALLHSNMFPLSIGLDAFDKSYDNVWS